MKYTVAQIAELLNAEIVGDASLEISTICKIEEGAPGGLTFLSNPKYTHYIYTTKATAAIVNKDFVPEHEVSCTLIKVENSYLAFAQLLNFYQEQQAATAKTGISPLACIAESAQIGQNVFIAEFVSVGEHAVIGDGARLYPHVCVGDQARVGARTVLNSGVKIYTQCVVGDDCILHAGAVIGADGFGFANQDGQYLKIPQIGNVVVGNHVEIGANTCIDRATMGSTKIGDYVKIDNLVQIAHNVEVGEGTAFAAQCGVAGSTKIGKHCIFAGQVGVAGHIHIDDNVVVGAQSGVTRSLKQGVYLGSPAIPAERERELIVYRRRLPEMYQQIRDLKDKQ
ncbi:MAG: UDP-3-O-(3-hydroxymyristoyl)glucosamine N-acyltransferase [Bacteroidales bacterium]|nr:UDP-3-O-(3-hydroxymyristoyl)glucosamine N-acyltransferase [Bacteroidales bacterium]